MANDLTGEFDVVLEFATPAVDRVLAAMHRCERFPHSISVSVDDNPPPGSKIKLPTAISTVDTFGDPIVDHGKFGKPILSSGSLAATDAVYSGLDALVNAGMVAVEVPIVPSKLQGLAQLQLFPPRLRVTDGSGQNITVAIDMLSRYFPDKNTDSLPEFMRGELQITAALNQVVTQAARVVDIDFKADHAYINFTSQWSSQTLTAEELTGINLAIRNAMKTSFLPSNATLPSNIESLQLKTLLAGQNAICLLLNLTGAPGNPATANNLFLSGADDFAFAVGADFILSALSFSQITDHRDSNYDITTQAPVVTLQNDQILLTINGHASGKHVYLPDLDFHVTQALTLVPVASVPSGPLNTAELALLGDISLNVHNVPDWVVNLFSGALNSVRQMRDARISQLQPFIRDKFSIDKNFGGFLNSLLNPAHPKPNVPPLEDVNFVLAYTSVGIQPSGIVLHGSVAVTDWPAAHIECQEIASSSGGGPQGGGLANLGFSYSALKTWIPGGSIGRYEWSPNGPNFPASVDDNRFVLLDAGILSPDTPGYSPLCLSISGSRLSSSGPVVAQPVNATICGYHVFPVVGGITTVSAGTLATIALTQSGPDGTLQVIGHTPAQVARPGSSTPNLLVHFADAKSVHNLAPLTRALQDSDRKDAPTAILAVLTPDQLSKASYGNGILFADNHNSAWEAVFGLKSATPPLTLIVAPNGKVLWQQAGELDTKALTAALQKHLLKGAPIRPTLHALNLRIGHLAPNFLFEPEPGRGLTLRKLAGRPVTLVFWNSVSRPSIEAARDSQKTASNSTILAINDGEDPELARRVAAENGLCANLVIDPNREIAAAYGVTIWPTTVLCDTRGVVSAIRYGRDAKDLHDSSCSSKTSA